MLKQFLADYPAHGIENNSTQYYQIVGKTATYIHNVGAFGGFYLDTNPYPASGCNDPATGTHCITDAQLQAEVTRVMTLKGWKTGGGVLQGGSSKSLTPKSAYIGRSGHIPQGLVQRYSAPRPDYSLSTDAARRRPILNRLGTP